MPSQSCVNMKYISRVRLYSLDSCGQMPITGSIVYDSADYNSVGWQNTFDSGTDETVTNTAGGICVDDPACPIDRGVTVTLAGCKENDTLSAMLGQGALKIVSTFVVGFDRMNISCNPQVAMEIIFSTPSLCAAGTPQCPAILFPLITKWQDTAARTADGKTTLRGTFVGKAKKNGSLFALSAAGKLPLELSHWSPYLTDISAGDKWYLKRIVNCPDLSTYAQGCEFRALSAQTP